MRYIFIEAGHGRKGQKRDPGAVAFGRSERDIVVQVAKQTIERIKQVPELKDAEVIPIWIDQELSLEKKISLINLACQKRGIGSENAILISLHCNASVEPGADGAEGWHISGSKRSEKLATCIATEIASFRGMRLRRSRGDLDNRHGRLRIRDVKPLPALIELGFISNKGDLDKLLDFSAMGRAVVRGIKSFYGI